MLGVLVNHIRLHDRLRRNLLRRRRDLGVRNVVEGQRLRAKRLRRGREDVRGGLALDRYSEHGPRGRLAGWIPSGGQRLVVEGVRKRRLAAVPRSATDCLISSTRSFAI